MNDEQHFRHELKYNISYADYLSVKQRLKTLMSEDANANEDGTYIVRSIYFDNDDNKALREKINGIHKREKFRIRFYNNDLSNIFLEKKMKIDRLCLKYSTRLTENELRSILTGDISMLRDSEDNLVREFYAKMSYQRLKPVIMVSYVREPYIYGPGNVRVTFDSEIRTTKVTEDILDRLDFGLCATNKPSDMIMEVKYDAFLPSIIQYMIQVNNVRQQSFSKYGACRKFG